MQGHNFFEDLFFLLPLIQRLVSGLEDKQFCLFEDKGNCLLYVKSFPLHGSGGFGGDVIDDAIDMVHLICNAV